MPIEFLLALAGILIVAALVALARAPRLRRRGPRLAPGWVVAEDGWEHVTVQPVAPPTPGAALPARPNRIVVSGTAHALAAARPAPGSATAAPARPLPRIVIPRRIDLESHVVRDGATLLFAGAGIVLAIAVLAPRGGSPGAGVLGATSQPTSFIPVATAPPTPSASATTSAAIASESALPSETPSPTTAPVALVAPPAPTATATRPRPRITPRPTPRRTPTPPPATPSPTPPDTPPPSPDPSPTETPTATP